MINLTLSFASDGEYRCDSVQNVTFRSLSNTVLGLSYSIDKVKELEKNGQRESALNLVEEELFKVTTAIEKYKNASFCYSLTKRANFKKDLLIKHQLELTILGKNLKQFDDCTYAITKLKDESKTISENNTFYEKFISTSKVITKAQIVRKDSSCNSAQKEELTALLEEQNTLLSRLYETSNNS